MLTKRLAIRAMFMGALAKMAHADEPPKPLDPSIWSATSPNVTIANWNKPMSWTVNLDMMTALHVTHGGEEVVITAAEIFAALKS